eukprot:CAMPEP_0182456348 /NCGR_PEP_ID=MMETSP1319-20130603/2211_1 /TAXON_ID=172717 /ORGANISM="Bolidomonas pacifica, Strain RCC208" /LENGTH=76 /DNA_ID=CAMNT_0024654571 /DNA_START=267 /DNA_END=500 /DNA_ORIENTATION=+
MSNLSPSAGTWTPPTAGGAPAAAPAAPKQSEKEEAAAIVAKAREEEAQRKADAAKVSKGMSKEELQALINSKTKKR